MCEPEGMHTLPPQIRSPFRWWFESGRLGWVQVEGQGAEEQFFPTALGPGSLVSLILDE